MKTQIKAEIVAHSKNPQNDELISVLCTFPRIILSEINTHRMLSKNTSSSRAIPFNKMVEAVENDPFIPIAWQKEHKGMQGNEYLEDSAYTLDQFILLKIDEIFGTEEKSKDFKDKHIATTKMQIENLLKKYENNLFSLQIWNWILSLEKSVEQAKQVNKIGVTKQLCNRLLEPFMWTTMLITGPKSGWDNFHSLRNPIYEIDLDNLDKLKDV